MNLKLFNEELYKNCNFNKCERCKTILVEGHIFDLKYTWKDPVANIDIDKTRRLCRRCCDELNAMLQEQEFIGS
jgi:hypothetical protein